jgi:hypothetical protein
MNPLTFRGFLHLLYVIGFTFVVVAALVGAPYYSLPLGDRPHAEMHTQLKPGGIWGHGIGIVGSAMVLLLLLYSARKRERLGLRFGPLSRWLDIHIFFGVIGPLLITLHTAMKFHGIVSVSYFSMVIVALSGVFGRYVYMQIPRDARGHALGIEEAQKRVQALRVSLADHLPPDAVEGITRFAGAAGEYNLSAPKAVMRTFVHDLTHPMRQRKLRKFLRAGTRKLPKEEIREVERLAREQSVMVRRVAMADTMTRLLHYWHVFHKPFAYIMIAIMFVHVAVAVSFGYKWVF